MPASNKPDEEPRDLHFRPVLQSAPGTLARCLEVSYQPLLASDPERWVPESARWDAFDREVFENPTTVAACVVTSWLHSELVGFASFDPRDAPLSARIGHNCILPEHQGAGLGRRQMSDVLDRLSSRKVLVVRASTGSHPFFDPARGMYRSLGFVEVSRSPWGSDPALEIVHFELVLTP